MLVDTNILIYAINEDSPKNKQALKFLRQNRNNLIVAHQNILEAIRVLTHSKFSKTVASVKACDAVFRISEAFEIIAPVHETLSLTHEIIRKLNLTGNRIFDAYLAATALTNGENLIATDNERDFHKIREIRVINPF